MALFSLFSSSLRFIAAFTLFTLLCFLRGQELPPLLLARSLIDISHNLGLLAARPLCQCRILILLRPLGRQRRKDKIRRVSFEFGFCPVHDTAMQEWRHLDFFQHQAFLHARVARISCPDCGVKQVAVPWARTGSGFTLLFEALVMTLVTAMPVRAAARLVGEHDTRLWRIVHHWVEAARACMDRLLCLWHIASLSAHLQSQGTQVCCNRPQTNVLPQRTRSACAWPPELVSTPKQSRSA